VIVQLTTTRAVVVEPDDCTRLHVSTELPSGEVGKALRATGTGTLDEDGSALLTLAVLRDRARSLATAEDWDQRWEAMIGYARKKGWVGADGSTVRAHIESAQQEPR
jgi:hypothetical protein